LLFFRYFSLKTIFFVYFISGLGTSTAKEAKEYFSNMDRHRIILKYSGNKDDLALQLAFNSCLADDRKEWIKWHTEHCKQQREQNLPADYLYKKNTKQINFTDFVNKELILFSKSNTERAIPNIMVKKSICFSSLILFLLISFFCLGWFKTRSTKNYVCLFYKKCD